MTHTEKYLSFVIGSKHRLTDDQKQVLVEALAKPPHAAENRLSGRISPCVLFLHDFGTVVIKHYFRGGIVRHVNRRTYMKIGKTRGQAEYEMICLVREMGINAPRPVAYASRSKPFPFYHAWLVTKEIPGTETLADLSESSPDRAEAILPEVATQINSLIRHTILHVDLHPGNILVDADDRAYLLDFDKARTGIKNKSRLADFYRRRWRRAVIKHQLPGFMDTGLTNRLLS